MTSPTTSQSQGQSQGPHRRGADLLMLHGVVADCPDCRGPRVMLPTDGPEELCCTGCDAAVFVVTVPGRAATDLALPQVS